MIFTLLSCFSSLFSQDYNPEFAPGPAMHTARMSHLAVLFPNDRLLLAGGHGDGFVSLSSAELFLSEPDTFLSLTMNYTHDNGAFAKLSDGRLLLVGGAADLGVAPGFSHAEIYDPETGAFTAISNMNYARNNCSAVTLADNRVLIVGGWYDVPSTTYGELFEPDSQQFSLTGALNVARALPVVLPTTDSGAVVLGGLPAYGGSVHESVEYYDAQSNTFSIIADYIFGPDETGWSPFVCTSYNRLMETQQMADGSYLMMAYKTVDNYTEYRLFGYNPDTKEFKLWNTEPQFPNSSSYGYYAPLVDQDKNVAYIPALVSGADPYQMALFAVNLLDSTLIIPETYYQLPANYYTYGSNFYLLSDGRILVSGGHTQTGYNTNFSPHNQTFVITPNYTPPTSIDHPQPPQTYDLRLMNYPNPFNNSTVFEFRLDSAQPVILEIYNAAGQRIDRLVDQVLPAGNHRFTWTADQLASGVYYGRLITKQNVASQKIILIK